MNQGKLVMMVSFVIMSQFTFFTEEALVFLKQEKQVAYFTHQYIVLYLPGIFFQGANDLLVRFLNSFKKQKIAMYCCTLAVVMHPLWCYVFAIMLGFNLIGIALAGCVSNLISFILMTS